LAVCDVSSSCRPTVFVAASTVSDGLDASSTRSPNRMTPSSSALPAPAPPAAAPPPGTTRESTNVLRACASGVGVAVTRMCPGDMLRKMLDAR
jgi:hypothetical protein